MFTLYFCSLSHFEVVKKLIKAPVSGDVDSLLTSKYFSEYQFPIWISGPDFSHQESWMDFCPNGLKWAVLDFFMN